MPRDSEGALFDWDKNEQKTYLLIWALLSNVPERVHYLSLIKKKKVFPAEDSTPYFISYNIFIKVKEHKILPMKNDSAEIFTRLNHQIKE